jgi:hypothetical protein
MTDEPTTPDKVRIAHILEESDDEFDPTLLLQLIWGYREELIAWAGPVFDEPMDPNKSYMAVLTPKQMIGELLRCERDDELDDDLIDCIGANRKELIAWAKEDAR